MADPGVLATAWNEQRVLITNDRDFGDLVIHQQQPHAGVILFRLGDGALLVTKIERLEHVLMNFADELDQDHYLVVTRDRVRVRRSDEPS